MIKTLDVMKVAKLDEVDDGLEELPDKGVWELESGLVPGWLVLARGSEKKF